MTAHDSFCAQDVPVVGFMSGGMVIDTVSEGFCNYLVKAKQRERNEQKDDAGIGGRRRGSWQE